MHLFKILILSILLSASSMVMAQKGVIRGQVIDDETGEALIGATVVISGTTNGTATDFEGNYSLANLETGLYDLQVSYISYQTKTVSGVEVKAGEASLLDVRLSSDVQQLENVVVTAEVIRNSEAALTTVKRKSANVLDGISAQTFRKIGDSDAASAIKRVPGVSIQGGKYVFVRGLGDRYTKTVLNSMEIPGLDPDRNSIQMDIFPTNVIDNMIVKKSFTADLPADFTGGIVDIEIKDFPEEKTMSVSGSFGVNPDMHFNDNYLDYAGGKNDILGFDDGTRDLPFSSQTDIPLYVSNDPRLTEITRSFDPTFGASPSTSFANYSLGLSLGNQFNRAKSTFGYNAALSYRNNTTFYENVEDNSLYVKNRTLSVEELDLDRKRTGAEGTNNVTIGGLLGLALKVKSSKFKITALHVQNGESTANIINEENFLDASNRSVRHALAYSERSITNILAGGEHHFTASRWAIEWKLTPTFSTINDKDVRLVPFTLSEEGALSIEPSEGGNPKRLWRFLNEVNYSGKIDFSKEYDLGGRTNKLLFGVANTYKEREFSIDNFNFLVRNESAVGLEGNPDNLLKPENIWTPDSGQGTYVIGNYQESNSYQSTITNLGFYVSNEWAVTERFKAILGVRAEMYAQNYTGGDQDYFNSNGQQGTYLDDEEVLSSFKPFPTANLIYNLVDNANLRLSYARTVARPSFKEKSIAQIFDPISNTTWIGNIDLIETDINNFDLRYEYFFKGSQTVALSGFYKTFSNPIEVVVYSENTPKDFTARNNGDAQVFGAEFEFRKNLEFISPVLDNLSLNANATFVHSSLKMDSAEYESRKLNLRQDADGNVIEELDDTREMQGQSPYLINVGLNYDHYESGWEAGLYYNVQGSTLTRVGVGEVPDLYTNPFHSLNATIKKSFGVDKNSSLALQVSNILDDKTETFFESFGASDQISSSRSLGRTYTLRFSYNF